MILKQTTKIESCIQTMTQLSFNSKPISLVTPIHQWPLDGQSTLILVGMCQSIKFLFAMDILM